MGSVNYAFFVDFDGTIATIDVCEALVTKFCRDGWQEINARWERKELSTVECARETFKLFTTTNPEDFYRFLDQVEIDPGFAGFVTFCRDHGYPLTILSDGYDFYIEYLLKREGLELPYYANKLLFPSLENSELSGNCRPFEKRNASEDISPLANCPPSENVSLPENISVSENFSPLKNCQTSRNHKPQLDLQAPYTSATCDLCGVCKLELMQKLAPLGHKTVYIGDGYSDFCPAQHADIVFAKPRLYEHCLKVGKKAFLFTDFTNLMAKFRWVDLITGTKY